jgi:hypothetical protein
MSCDLKLNLEFNYMKQLLFIILVALVVPNANAEVDPRKRADRSPGKGVGAGGGPSLRTIFQNSIGSADWIFKQGLTHSGWRDEKCDPDAEQWLNDHRHDLREFIKSRPLRWADYFSPESAENASSLQCLEVRPDQFLLRYAPCRDIVSNNVDAGVEIISQILKTNNFGLTEGSLKQQVIQCFGLEVDSQIFPLAIGLDAGRWIDYTDPNNTGWQGNSPDDPRMSNDPKVSIPADLNFVRSVTVPVLRNLHNMKIPSDQDQSLLQWLFVEIEGKSRAQILAEDIANTRYIVTDLELDQSTCARTSFEPHADVRFVIGRCKEDFSNTLHIVQTVVHEATHHAPIAVEDEVLADAIGELVASIVFLRAAEFHEARQTLETTSIPADTEVRYSDSEIKPKVE